MKILALYFGHDAGCTLLDGGRPVAVLEKERLSRVKHDQGAMDIEPVLQEYGWDPGDIDLVVFNPYVRPDARGRRLQWDIDGDLYTAAPDYDAPNLSCPPEARSSSHRLRLLGREYEALAVDHHLAHMAGALFTSPFERAAMLSADGGGDNRACALGWGEGNRITALEYGWGLEGTGRMQLNIGRTWASIGEYSFGMARLEGAGKLMGLSSYGQARAELLPVIEQQMLFHPFSPFPRKADGAVGPARLRPESGYAQDVCASLQELTCRLYLRAAARARELSGMEHLVLTGGCSMNCGANTAVHASGLFTDTFVPAQPHDGGLSLGMALFAWHHVLDQPRTPRAWSPYLGTDAGRMDPAMIPEIVEHLLAGRAVGLCFGRAESGPRALGHRSILLDPRLPHGRDLLNNQVKMREWYRPFAPMVLAEAAPDWGVPSRYMSYIVPTRASEVPAVTHVDGTSRPQMVDQDSDPFILALLRAWREASGCALLLNTSFNCQEPLVDTVEQARATWRRTGLHVLATPEGMEVKEP